MPVIACVSPKGGVGKTTFAVLLATELARNGDPITLIDADPNYPIATWANLPNKPESIDVILDKSEETILDNIGTAAQSSKIVIVDLEGIASLRVSYAISCADLVIIPLKGSMLDANEATKAISLINRTEKAFSRKINYTVLFCQMPAAIPRKNFKDIAAQFTELDIPVSDIWLIEREAYRTIFSVGGSIYDLNEDQVGGLESARANSYALAEAIVDNLKKINRSKT